MAGGHKDNDRTQSYLVLSQGTTVDHYRIVEKIGAGGMGEVYLAQDTELDRKVALKFLPPHLCQDQDCRKRFKREAQAAAKLSHPNIVTIHDVGEFYNRPFIVMEYVEGRSLKEHIQQGDIIHERIIVGAIQICDGLQTAHSAGIIHRDIKPSNIILDVNRRPRILDFGLAAVSGTEQLTKTGSTMGTVGYMSPEQISGREVDHRSDLFSIGVVLYELFSGRPPFKGDTEAATHQAILHNTAEPLARYNSRISDDLQRIVSKLLEKDPELRYQSAAGLISDLKKLAQSRSDICTASPAVGADVRPSIAVLPFENLSADPEQEYFCDGVAEEIINALTHVDGLHVVARTSAFAFKRKQADIREIGRKLNVETILEGSIQKAGKRVRITTQLVKVANGYHLWSEKYDRDMVDIFAIQDEIGLAVANKLKVELLGEEKKAILKRHTHDLEAHNLYLKGIYFLRMYTADGFKQAIDYFERALEKDPNYALAYYGLAEVFYVATYFGKTAPSEAYPAAKGYAKKALEIDHALGEAHAVLGLVYVYYEWNWKLAESELKQALQLTPNSAMVHMSYSWFLSLTEHHNDAIIEVRQAQELDPLSNVVNTHVGFACIWASQYDSAIEELQKTITMYPSFYLTHYYLGLAYRAKSMIDEAVSEFEKAIELGSGIAWPAMILAATYLELGKNTQGKKLFESLKRRSKHEYVPPMGFFYIHLALGEMDKALDCLKQACTQHDSFLPWCNIIPIDCYRIPDEPRFRDLLTKAGLV